MAAAPLRGQAAAAPKALVAGPGPS